MDPAIIAAVITAIATVIAVIVGAFFQHRKSDRQVPPNAEDGNREKSAAEDTTPAQFARRYIDQPSHIRFIESLPKLKAVVLENAQKGWDTGVTLEMREASYDVIDFLEYVWLRLAEFYPPSHFGKKDSKSYIQDYIKDRFAFHWSKHEPHGPGTGGTIVGVLTGGDVIHDLEEMIVDTVQALFAYNDKFNYQEWIKEWRGNKQ